MEITTTFTRMQNECSIIVMCTCKEAELPGHVKELSSLVSYNFLLVVHPLV